MPIILLNTVSLIADVIHFIYIFISYSPEGFKYFCRDCMYRVIPNNIAVSAVLPELASCQTFHLLINAMQLILARLFCYQIC